MALLKFFRPGAQPTPRKRLIDTIIADPVLRAEIDRRLGGNPHATYKPLDIPGLPPLER